MVLFHLWIFGANKSNEEDASGSNELQLAKHKLKEIQNLLKMKNDTKIASRESKVRFSI